jgi:hypothetical protein
VGLAGRTDCIGEFDGVPSVIDFKSSNYPKSEDAIQDYFMQATAYSLMWQDRTGQELRNIAILIGVEDGDHRFSQPIPASTLLIWWTQSVHTAKNRQSKFPKYGSGGLY